jgi:hypothetical protein
MKKILLVGLTISLSLLALVRIACADTIVDTGKISTPQTNNWTVSKTQWLGGRFSTTENYSITSVEGYMWGYSWGANTLKAAIYTDKANLPGTELYSMEFTFNGNTLNTSDWHGASGLNWSLTSGNYWVVFEGTSDLEGGFGYMTNTATAPLEEALAHFGTWGHVTAPLNLSLRVLGDKHQNPPVPQPPNSPVLQPATMLLLLSPN